MMRSPILSALLTLSVLGSVACNDDTSPTEPAPAVEAPTAPAPAPAPAPAVEAPAAPAAAEGGAQAMVVLKGVQMGDAACYLEVASAAGETITHKADFELCPGGGQDVSGRIGQSVHLQTRRESVMAASCQGDPECAEQEEVDLVVAIH